MVIFFKICQKWWNVEKKLVKTLKTIFALIFFYTLDIKNIILTQSFTNIFLPSLVIENKSHRAILCIIGIQWFKSLSLQGTCQKPSGISAPCRRWSRKPEFVGLNHTEQKLNFQILFIFKILMRLFCLFAISSLCINIRITWFCLNTVSFKNIFWP